MGLLEWFGLSRVAEDRQVSRLIDAVERQLPGAEERVIRYVAALSGLLARVAYADARYTPEEEGRVREILCRQSPLPPEGVEAVCRVLREHVGAVAAVESPMYQREIRALCDRDERVEVLAILLEVAAADGSISLTEVNSLRQITAAIGLTQADYNELQAAHRERLDVLRRT